MALSKEDHKDVKGALGKAMANKISKVTNDGTRRVPVTSKTPGVYRSGADTTSTKRGNTKLGISNRPSYM